MAKKSNKTEHVLKLITKNDDAAQEDVFFAIDEISINGTSAGKNITKPDPAGLPEEIELGLDQLMGIEPVIPEAVPEAPEAEPADEIFEGPANEKIEESFEASAVLQPMEREPVIQEPPEPPTLRAFREQENGPVILPDSNEELVNIAEVLAREKLLLVMERMKVCSCKTCVNDVLALALNSLPTKYVTTDAGKQYFQRDEYKKQYETEILAALTKACVRVKASPRHQQQ